MLIGQSVFSASGNGAVYYGPWLPRQGDVLQAAVQFLGKSGTISSFTCGIETKNREDSDGSATTLASITVDTGTTGKVSTQQASGCLELVRYVYTIANSTLQWVHFRGLAPIWQRN